MIFRQTSVIRFIKLCDKKPINIILDNATALPTDSRPMKVNSLIMNHMHMMRLNADIKYANVKPIRVRWLIC